MNLHILNSKLFIANAKQEFSKTGLENEFVMLNDQGAVPVDGNYKSFDVAGLTEYIKQTNPERIIIHFLGGPKAKAIIDSGYSGVIYWNSWGGDLYNEHFNISDSDLYDNKSLEFIKEHKLFEESSKIYKARGVYRSLLLLLHRILRNERHTFSYIGQILKRISYCSTVLPSEYPLIVKSYPHIQFRDFTYGNLNSFIPEQMVDFNSTELGNKIIIGSSSSPTHNHITAIDLISSSCDIVVPLAYGQEKYRSKLIEKYGSNRSIEFLTEMKPYDVYLDVLTQCNTMVMIQKRQHALGNIIVGLYFGMRLYMDPKNQVYIFLKSLGVKVFDFNSDFHIYKNEPLSKEDVKSNRAALNSYWGDEASTERMANYFS